MATLLSMHTCGCGSKVPSIWYTNLAKADGKNEQVVDKEEGRWLWWVEKKVMVR